MEALIVSGGRPLEGTVEIHGAKNAVLPILAATVLHGGVYRLHHCPEITDVRLAAEIIATLGGNVRRFGQCLEVDTTGVCRWTVPPELMARMRASVLFLGPLLVRFGRAELTMPGGCPLGRRPIDLHLAAMAQMGAEIRLEENRIVCQAGQLHGCRLELPFPSVGATENALLAAVGCRGTVTIRGGAEEPEIGDLVCFLQAMGAEICRKDGSWLVHGGAPLCGAVHTVLPDRIETATYLCAVAGCGGNVRLTGTDLSLLQPVALALEAAGCRIEEEPGGVRLQSEGRLRAVERLETAPYPGFPTDAQALMMAALLRADGTSGFYENIFERRFHHVAQLRKLGAKIETAGLFAQVYGVPHLHGAALEAPDLRAAAAIIIAAMQAEGKSSISGIKHLERGYDSLAVNLKYLGAEIAPVRCKNTTGNFS